MGAALAATRTFRVGIVKVVVRTNLEFVGTGLRGIAGVIPGESGETTSDVLRSGNGDGRGSGSSGGALGRGDEARDDGVAVEGGRGGADVRWPGEGGGRGA